MSSDGSESPTITPDASATTLKGPNIFLGGDDEVGAEAMVYVICDR